MTLCCDFQEQATTSGSLRKLQDRAQAFIDGVLQARWQCPGMFGQESAIQSQELRNIDHGVAGQARQARPQQHIARGIGKIRVAGDHRHYYGLNTAAVEGVRLDHKHRTPVTRLRTARLGKVGPPDLSRSNLVHLYQESFSREANWARCNTGSTLAGRRVYTSFRRSVTASVCRRLRNSASASAYN